MMINTVAGQKVSIYLHKMTYKSVTKPIFINFPLQCYRYIYIWFTSYCNVHVHRKVHTFFSASFIYIHCKPDSLEQPHLSVPLQYWHLVQKGQCLPSIAYTVRLYFWLNHCHSIKILVLSKSFITHWALSEWWINKLKVMISTRPLMLQTNELIRMACVNILWEDNWLTFTLNK